MPAADSPTRPYGRTRSWVVQLAVVITVGLAFVQLLGYGQDLRRQPAIPDRIGPARQAFANLARDLPPADRVGFLPTLTDPTLAAASLYVAQYGLAPRILEISFDRVRYVVAGPTASPQTDADPRLSGFHLAAIRDGGIPDGQIRVYRRVP